MVRVGLLLLVFAPGLFLGLGGASAEEGKEGPPPGPDGSPPAGKPGAPGAVPEREGSGKVRKERRPEPGERGEGPESRPPGLDAGAVRIDARVREIQLALLDEIIRVEERLAAIRRKLESELGLPGPPFPAGALASPPLDPSGGAPGIPRKQARKTLRPGPAPQDLEEERRYRSLLDREREIVAQWKKAGVRRKGSGDESAEGERGELRAELERVLREILDLRERARERQLERLRSELDEIQRALKLREDEKERERLVNARMRELLER